MLSKKAKRLMLFIAGLPLLGMVACSSGGSSAKVTDNPWKAEYGVEDGGDGKRISAPPNLFFAFKEDGSFVMSQSSDMAKYYERDGEKIKLYHSEDKEKQEDTWKIEELTADTLKILSEDKDRVMVHSASEKSMEEVAK